MKNKKNILRWALSAAVVLGPFGVAFGEGCGLEYDVCDALCECSLCNDREEDACHISVETTLDAADDYDCTPEAEALADCIINDADCDHNAVQIADCADEYTDLAECAQDGSEHDLGGNDPIPIGLPIFGVGEGEGEGEGEGQGGVGLIGGMGGGGTAGMGGTGLVGGAGGAGGGG